MLNFLSELFVYRQVLLVLVFRDLKARYRGSVLGLLWTLLNPLLLMATYSLVFAVYVRVEIPEYPIFVFSGLLPWIWFSSALMSGANSIVDAGTLIKRVAFAPQVLPAVAVTATLVNFLLALPLLLAFALSWGLPITWAILLLPIPIAIQFVFTLALTITVSMLGVRYRDLNHLLGNVVTLWFFLTPIVYPATSVPDRFRASLLVNPLTPLIVSFQDILYRGRPPEVLNLALAAVVALLALMAAVAVGRRLRWTIVEQV